MPHGLCLVPTLSFFPLFSLLLLSETAMTMKLCDLTPWLHPRQTPTPTASVSGAWYLPHNQALLDSIKTEIHANMPSLLENSTLLDSFYQEILHVVNDPTRPQSTSSSSCHTSSCNLTLICLDQTRPSSMPTVPRQEVAEGKRHLAVCLMGRLPIALDSLLQGGRCTCLHFLV